MLFRLYLRRFSHQEIQQLQTQQFSSNLGKPIRNQLRNRAQTSDINISFVLGFKHIRPRVRVLVNQFLYGHLSEAAMFAEKLLAEFFTENWDYGIRHFSGFKREFFWFWENVVSILKVFWLFFFFIKSFFLESWKLLIIKRSLYVLLSCSDLRLLHLRLAFLIKWIIIRPSKIP